MPLLILEYTSNLSAKSSTKSTLLNLHHEIGKMIDAGVEHFKSRIICRDEYVAMDNHPDNAFVLLTIDMLAGRSLDKRQAVGEYALEQLKQLYQEEAKTFNLQLCVRINEMEKACYFKA